MPQWSKPSYLMHSLRQPERSRRFKFAGDVRNNRLHLTAATVTPFAYANVTPWPLRGLSLQVKPTLGGVEKCP